jgi:hypothetical protein
MPWRIRYTSTDRSVPNTFVVDAAAGPSVPSFTALTSFQVISRMAAIRARHLARSTWTHGMSATRSDDPGAAGVDCVQSTTSSKRRIVSPDIAPSPTRS